MDLVLSIFPGLGLLDMAFELEGYCVVRGPDVLWGGDVRRFHPPAGKFNGIIGGPPCQSFSSLAHLVRANGHEPKFGNLIPEFERVVAEAECDWFVMENVRAAPTPVVPGYGTKDFLLDNSWLDGGDGWGQEQIRLRRFTFGLRGRKAPDLRRWIDLAALLLPDAARNVTQGTGFPHDEAFKARSGPVTATHDSLENVTEWSRQRKKAMFGDGRPTRQEERNPDDETPRCRHCKRPTVGCRCGYCAKCCERHCKNRIPPCACTTESKDAVDAIDTADDQLEEIADSLNLQRPPRTRRQAVLSDPSAVPVKIGGSGKLKRMATRRQPVTSNVGGLTSDEAKRRGHYRYRLADALRLQGLPEDFLEHAPFTAEGKLKAVANGVPLPMGRSIARAVKEATNHAATA